ncbi:helix-turn-helix domain-containing protein [Parasedimentitalea marina]|uniref:Helix-turn-helix domain-containing protein n=2 Tax=Parasedimentitalea marina TaxID=2483033 RepID=A0A3T0N8M3_9RHOB|nr:helix-turn-helix domain-containing protein [Parasedimentitalea marina]
MARGGRQIYIPKTPTPNGALAKIVGEENAAAIIKLLGSGNVIIPTGNYGGETGRRQRIAALLDQGMSHAEIAAEVDVHVRTVERVAALLSGGRQQDFFL